MTGTRKSLSVLAAASCFLGLVGMAMLAPYASHVVYRLLHPVCREFTAWFLFCVPLTAAILGAVALRETRKKAARRGRTLALVGCILGTGVLAVVVVFLGLRVRAVGHYRICGHNMKKIEDAAQRLGTCVATNQVERDAQMKVILGQMPRGQLPECPAGGTYTITAPNGYTFCSKHGDRATCNQGI